MWEQDEVDTNIIEQLRYILSYHIIGSNGDTVQCSLLCYIIYAVRAKSRLCDTITQT